MKLTRERAIYLTVLGVGVSALVLGEVVFPTAPSSAAGAPAEGAVSAKEYAVPGASGGAKAASTAKQSPAALSVAEQLRGFDQADGVDILKIQDVFQTPAAMDHMTQVAEKASPSVPNPVDRFKQGHSLNGVMVANRQGKAIVDGKTLLVGQSMDGFKLTAVTQQTAVFESEAGEVVLRIPESPGGPAGEAKP